MNNDDFFKLQNGDVRMGHFLEESPILVPQHEFHAIVQSIIENEKLHSDKSKQAVNFLEWTNDIILDIKNFNEIRIKLERTKLEQREFNTYLNLPFKNIYLTFFGNYTFSAYTKNIFSEDKDFISRHDIRALYITEKTCRNIRVMLLTESFNINCKNNTFALKNGRGLPVVECYDFIFNNQANIYESNVGGRLRDEVFYLLRELCSQINSKKTVIHQVETDDAITIKRYPKKIRHRIRTVLYIHNKEEVIKNNKALKINLSCPYRFTVRGHWRKLENDDKVGKDREGNYTVQGFTWITDFIKGEKEKPLKETIRVIV